jgi:cysteine-rich repeat protein
LSIAGLDGDYVVGEGATGGTADTGSGAAPASSGAGGDSSEAGGNTGGMTGSGGAATTTTSTGTGGQPPACGDGMVDASEECDDGGTTAGDGCDGSCLVECSGPQTAKHPTTHHCYEFIDNALVTWDQARTQCMALGSGWDLATITSAGERDFVDDTLALPEGTAFANDDPYQYWLGGRDLTQQDQFEWVNGEPWSYTPWDTNPQDPSNGNQDCIRLRAIQGTSNDVFRDAVCTLTSSIVCELQPAGTTP